MKMIISVLILSQFVFLNFADATISKAKVAELTAHRIDRLVALNKIDSSFLTKLGRMDVSLLPNQAPAYYKVHVSETQSPQGAPLQLDVVYDEDGKPLSYQVISGNAGTDMGWTGIDSVSLAENSMHYVLDNSTDPKIKLFYSGLNSFSLTKGQLNGHPVAQSQMTSSETSEKLNVYLNLDGSFISSEVIP